MSTLTTCLKKQLNGPRVSVIIPVFNTEQYLHRCIESVMRQTLRDIEIILVDDGSIDTCGVICDEYALKDRRIRVIHQENLGAGGARNSGIKIAIGEYIGFVDSDDYIDPKLFERLYHAADEVQADVCYGGFVFLSKSGEIDLAMEPCPLLYEQSKIWEDYLPSLAIIRKGRKKKDRYRYSVCGAVYKRNVIQRNGVLFNDGKNLFGEDMLFNIDFCRHASLVRFLPEARYYIYFNPQSSTRTYRRDFFEAGKSLYRLYCVRAKAMGFHDTDPLTNYILLSCALSCTLHVMSHQKLLGRKEVLAKVREIMSDTELTSVLKRYPLRKLPFMKMVFFLFMRRGSPWTLYILCQFNTVRKLIIKGWAGLIKTEISQGSNPL